MKALPSQRYLRECFDYDAERGLLIWRERPRHHFRTAQGWAAANAVLTGLPCGRIKDGVVRGILDGRTYKVSRLIFKWVTGRNPPRLIDHRDGDHANNKWSNLRPATTSQNNANCGPRPHNRLGVKGVRIVKGGSYQARISIDGKIIHIGCFATADEAQAAYFKAARERWGRFARI